MDRKARYPFKMVWSVDAIERRFDDDTQAQGPCAPAPSTMSDSRSRPTPRPITTNRRRAGSAERHPDHAGGQRGLLRPARRGQGLTRHHAGGKRSAANGANQFQLPHQWQAEPAVRRPAVHPATAAVRRVRPGKTRPHHTGGAVAVSSRRPLARCRRRTPPARPAARRRDWHSMRSCASRG